MTRTTQADNRWSPREPVTLDVTLHVPGQFPFPGMIRNVSLGGLFVETDTARLAGAVEIYIAFSTRNKTKPHQYRVPAHSSRLHGNGVVLVFSVPDIRLTQALRQLLYPAPALVRVPAPDAPLSSGQPESESTHTGSRLKL